MRNRILLLIVFLLVSSAASAQGLRVSTVVYDAGSLNEAGQEPIVSTGFSLFHNGRVYDYVESAEEVVVFSPVDHRFTVLNEHRRVYTTIDFREVDRLLEARIPKTEEYLRELTARGVPDAERAGRILQFQLSPQFESTYDSKRGLLKLTSPSWKYTVSTREWDDEEQLEKYLTFADWTARLNYVLHPSGMFPEPRLALNEELRKRKLRIPVVVQLDLRPDERRVLRAEHQFIRKLTDQDRQLISRWDGLLRNSELKQLPFRGYQEAQLMSHTR